MKLREEMMEWMEEFRAKHKDKYEYYERYLATGEDPLNKYATCSVCGSIDLQRWMPNDGECRHCKMTKHLQEEHQKMMEEFNLLEPHIDWERANRLAKVFYSESQSASFSFVDYDKLEFMDD